MGDRFTWFSLPLRSGRFLSRDDVTSQDGSIASLQLFNLSTSFGFAVIISSWLVSQQTSGDIIIMTYMLIMCTLLINILMRNYSQHEGQEPEASGLSVARIIKDQLPLVGLYTFYVPGLILDVLYLTIYADRFNGIALYCGSSAIFDASVNVIYHILRIPTSALLLFFCRAFYGKRIVGNAVTARYSLMTMLSITVIMWFDTFVDDFWHETNPLGPSPDDDAGCTVYWNDDHITPLDNRGDAHDLLISLTPYFYPLHIEFALLASEIITHVYQALSDEADIVPDEQPSGPRVERRPSSLSDEQQSGPRVEGRPSSINDEQQSGPRVERRSSSLNDEQQSGPRVEGRPSSLNDEQQSGSRVEERPSSVSDEQQSGLRVEGRSSSLNDEQQSGSRVEERPSSVSDEQQSGLRVEGRSSSLNDEQQRGSRVEGRPSSLTVEQSHRLRVQGGSNSGASALKITTAALIAILINVILFIQLVVLIIDGSKSVSSQHPEYITHVISTLYYICPIVIMYWALSYSREFEPSTNASAFSWIEYTLIVCTPIFSLQLWMNIIACCARMFESKFAADATPRMLWSLLNMYGIYLQTSFMLHASRIRPKNNKAATVMRQTLIFCTIFNISQWVIDSFVEVGSEKVALFDQEASDFYKHRWLYVKQRPLGADMQNYIHAYQVSTTSSNDSSAAFITFYRQVGNNFSKAIGDMYYRTNLLLARFHTCSSSTLSFLFRSYCTSFYGSPLCPLDDASLGRLSIAWRRSLKRVWRISRLGCGGSNTNKTVCNSLLELMTVSAQLGFNSWGFNNSMQCQNPTTDLPTPCCCINPLPAPSLYLMIGTQGMLSSSSAGWWQTFEFYGGGNPASKSVKSINLKESNPEWKSEQEMLQAEQYPLIVQFADKVYAFGRWGTSVTQEFDPALNEWRMRSQMPGRCCCGSAVALGDKIYVVGGSQRVCYSYDPNNDEWEVLSKPTHYYYTNAATVWKGKIMLGDRKHVEEYDPVDDRWSNRDELLPGGDINKMFIYASCSF
ncbi:hypothetical protein CAPTEDRAFT_209471 [Capitella teleta]|uniref:Uncharacterized protein n=1 Tax=Capitella teleta TaxID=283909 RepID=R7UET6_CAPTE|nr:hypothetical protein CAPTEDRAFT_209471 [Capitella teleta]|eukprot:ELU02308.1 hypothetical protein CAPTEDRAFT_209471 [Capitella teleta]